MCVCVCVCVCGGGGWLCRPAAACFISVDERQKGLLNVWCSACRGCCSCACGGTFLCEVLEQSGPGQGAKIILLELMHFL